jgi:hypothetical protein
MTATHHPGTEPRGHPVTECSPETCGRPRRDVEPRDTGAATLRAAADVLRATPGLGAAIADMLDTAAASREPTDAYAAEAARGRIILGWLGAHGAEIITMNDRPFLAKLDQAALREGVSGLISAGPEYDLADPTALPGGAP